MDGAIHRRGGQLGAASIAFPLISAGAYGWPVRSAVELAIGELHPARQAELVRLVLWQPETLTLAQRVLAAGTRAEADTA